MRGPTPIQSIISLSLLSLLLSPTSNAAPPRGNGTWIYDALYSQGPTGPPFNQAGLYRQALSEYNAAAESHAPANQISILFTYGGSLEQDCRGSGLSAESLQKYPDLARYLGYIPCIVDLSEDNFYDVGYSTMWAGYGAPPVGSPPQQDLGTTGRESTAAYAKTTGAKYIMPVVDGRLGDTGLYLKNFDRNDDGYLIDQSGDRSSMKANVALAELIAKLYCADDLVAGIQVDLEPFDIDSAGQQSFYSALGRLLTGSKYGCVDPKHPEGRYMSNFSFPGHWSPDGTFTPLTPAQWHTFKSSFGRNGFFMVSGYDLGPGGPGEANSLEDYAKYLYDELSAMKQAAKDHGIYYMVGIPAAASTKEFEQTTIYPATFGARSGNSQLDYIRAAMGVMFDKDASGASYDAETRALLPDTAPYTTPLDLRGDEHFLGWSLWSWATYLSYPPHSNHLFLPHEPPSDVLSFLAGTEVTGGIHYTVDVVTQGFPEPVQLKGTAFTYSDGGGSQSICTGSANPEACKPVGPTNGKTTFKVPGGANFTIVSQVDGEEICKVPANRKDPVTATEIWPPAGFTGTYTWTITSNGTASGNTATCDAQRENAH